MTTDAELNGAASDPVRIRTVLPVAVDYVEALNVSGYDYHGSGLPGATSAQAKWQIFRRNRTTNAISFANGSEEFNLVWDNRTTYTYTN